MDSIELVGRAPVLATPFGLFLILALAGSILLVVSLMKKGPNKSGLQAVAAVIAFIGLAAHVGAASFYGDKTEYAAQKAAAVLNTEGLTVGLDAAEAIVTDTVGGRLFDAETDNGTVKFRAEWREGELFLFSAGLLNAVIPATGEEQ